jgi:hypothetical protein
MLLSFLDERESKSFPVTPQPYRYDKTITVSNRTAGDLFRRNLK